MLDWKKLVHLFDEQLAAYDLAQVNLACVVDLPDADQIDQDRCLHKLDHWARRVKQYTEPRMPLFHRKRWDYENSEGYFRILCLVTVLQRDLGLRYNPAKIPDDVPLDTADTFIHGALLGAGGTCGSMAVVYAAVGRRLGYPLKLVRARRGEYGHLFPRWEDPHGERFNIEATNKGLTCYPDDHYRTGAYTVDPDIERRTGLLKSMTPTEELAGFLLARGHRWLDFGSRRRAVESFLWASAVAPQNEGCLETAKIEMNRWTAAFEAHKPPHFPEIHIGMKGRRFPDAVPLDIEQNLLGLEATENLLSDPEYERLYWGPLRKGLRPRSPSVALMDFAPDGSCHGEFRFQEPPRGRPPSGNCLLPDRRDFLSRHRLLGG